MAGSGTPEDPQEAVSGAHEPQDQNAQKAQGHIRVGPDQIFEGGVVHPQGHHVAGHLDVGGPGDTRQQFEQFSGICQELNRIGLPIPIRHVCNSAATMRFPDMHLEMVRPGLILYGMVPPGCPEAWPDLQPAMSLKSNLVLVKQVPAQTSISYGRTYETKRDSLIGTIPIGYADGYSRRLQGRGQILVQGQRVPVIGRICMDSCMVDLTDLEQPPAVGDEVVLFGAQGNEGAAISIDEAAGWMETINYEAACLIGRRVPRAYLRNGMLDRVQSYLLKP
ncbi:MAG: alanine racemase [Clostridia bacterium]|nr:alanine racemase [Clostridia bacterium]